MEVGAEAEAEATYTTNSLDTIGKSIQNTFQEYFKPSRDYELIFTFDAEEYSTIFTFRHTGLTNGCITISYDNDDDMNIVSSMIRSNNSYRRCFNPVLSSNLPEGVKQTDILQVLNTKLKFILRYPEEEVTLIDDAKLPDPEKRGSDVFSVPFSYWRVVRGEKPIYEKYGYSFAPFNSISKFARERTWDQIKHVSDKKTGKKINDIWIELYPCEKIDDKDTIATVMKKTGDKQSERASQIVRVVFNTIKSELQSNNNYDRQFHFAVPTFTLHKSSAIWQGWDKRLKIVSFKPVSDEINNVEVNNKGTNVGNSSGGSRVRKTRRGARRGARRERLRSKSSRSAKVVNKSYKG